MLEENTYFLALYTLWKPGEVSAQFVPQVLRCAASSTGSTLLRILMPFLEGYFKMKMNQDLQGQVGTSKRASFVDALFQKHRADATQLEATHLRCILQRV
jgi:hypothetical protein